MQKNLDFTSIIDLLIKNRKSLLTFIFIATLIGTITSFLLPKYYLSSTTVIPANPKLTDKNFLYGQNVMELNSAYGMEEDLDRLLTSLRLSSNFSTVVDSFKLIEHYKMDNNSKAKANAQETLIKNSTIVRTDNGAIKVSIWDTDKEYAANIANAIVQITERKTSENNQQFNTKYVEGLQIQLQEKIKQLDSTSIQTKNSTVVEIEKKNLLALIEQDSKTITQIKSSLQSKIPSIIVLEKAYPSTIADKPKKLYWALISFFGSAIFGILLLVVLSVFNKKK